MVSQHIEAARSDWAGKAYEEIGSVGDADGSVLVVPIGSIEVDANDAHDDASAVEPPTGEVVRA